MLACIIILGAAVVLQCIYWSTISDKLRAERTAQIENANIWVLMSVEQAVKALQIAECDECSTVFRCGVCNAYIDNYGYFKIPFKDKKITRHQQCVPCAEHSSTRKSGASYQLLENIDENMLVVS